MLAAARWREAGVDGNGGGSGGGYGGAAAAMMVVILVMILHLLGNFGGVVDAGSRGYGNDKPACTGDSSGACSGW